jgi:predicted acetyltransferase
MDGLDVALAAPHERAALENLFQLYIHDFSEILAPDRPEGDVGPDGRFPLPPLDELWRDGDQVPLLLRLDGRLAGFALLDRSPHSGRPVDWDMREFFVVRKHRRRGLGLAAAHAIFGERPGQWELAVMRANTAALPFWRKAAATHPLARGVEEIDLATSAWNGPVIRFRIAPS